MKDRTLIVDIFSKTWRKPEEKSDDENVAVFGEKRTVCGMIDQIRKQSEHTFVSLTDGSCIQTIQLVFDTKKDGMTDDYKKVLESCTKGATIGVTGTIVESPGKGQVFDLEPDADGVTVFGLIDHPETYPIAKSKLKQDYLRTVLHLRARDKTVRIVSDIRNTLSWATHQFFQDRKYHPKRKFQYIHTPLITSSDCEGAGETFRLTTLKPGETDFSKDFFGKEVALTVSGQLDVETYAGIVGDVYTFGPTFRAEESNTTRHLAEFWMIEPEIAFATFDDVVELATSYLKHCVRTVLEKHPAELDFLEKLHKDLTERPLTEQLKVIVEEDFHRMTYTQVIELLEKDIKDKKIIIGIPEKIQKSQKHKTFFEHEIKWGSDLASEAEKYLTDKVFKKPVIVTDYPRGIKAFYMKDNKDEQTVQAMDILVPGIGEIIGGSAREEDYSKLLTKVKEQGISEESLGWYLDLRRYGTMPHGGFGLGFERLVMLVTGVKNIKDVIPFPRYHKHCEC